VLRRRADADVEHEATVGLEEEGLVADLGDRLGLVGGGVAARGGRVAGGLGGVRLGGGSVCGRRVRLERLGGSSFGGSGLFLLLADDVQAAEEGFGGGGAEKE
jgi:hypothetical protein